MENFVNSNNEFAFPEYLFPSAGDVSAASSVVLEQLPTSSERKAYILAKAPSKARLDRLARQSKTDSARDVTDWAREVLDFHDLWGPMPVETINSVVSVLKSLARNGNHEAAYALGSWGALKVTPNSEETIVSGTDRRSFLRQGLKNGVKGAWCRVAMNANERGDAEQAFSRFQRGADKKDPACLYTMGLAHMQGQFGLAQNVERGINLIELSVAGASTEFPRAPYLLGKILIGEGGCGPNGLGIEGLDGKVPQDRFNAGLDMIAQSACLGFAPALLRMADAYLGTNGGNGDSNEAAGKGGERGFDAGIALRYLSLAACQETYRRYRGEPPILGGKPESQIVKWLLCGYEKVIAKSEEWAFRFAQVGALDQNGSALFALAYFNEVGIATEQNFSKAAALYQLSADRGFSPALARLNQMKTGKPALRRSLTRREHEARMQKHSAALMSGAVSAATDAINDESTIDETSPTIDGPMQGTANPPIEATVAAPAPAFAPTTASTTVLAAPAATPASSEETPDFPGSFPKRKPTISKVGSTSSSLSQPQPPSESQSQSRPPSQPSRPVMLPYPTSSPTSSPDNSPPSSPRRGFHSPNRSLVGIVPGPNQGTSPSSFHRSIRSVSDLPYPIDNDDDTQFLNSNEGFSPRSSNTSLPYPDSPEGRLPHPGSYGSLASNRSASSSTTSLSVPRKPVLSAGPIIPPPSHASLHDQQAEQDQLDDRQQQMGLTMSRTRSSERFETPPPELPQSSLSNGSALTGPVLKPVVAASAAANATNAPESSNVSTVRRIPAPPIPKAVPVSSSAVSSSAVSSSDVPLESDSRDAPSAPTSEVENLHMGPPMGTTPPMTGHSPTLSFSASVPAGCTLPAPIMEETERLEAPSMPISRESSASAPDLSSGDASSRRSHSPGRRSVSPRVRPLSTVWMSSLGSRIFSHNSTQNSPSHSANSSTSSFEIPNSGNAKSVSPELSATGTSAGSLHKSTRSISSLALSSLKSQPQRASSPLRKILGSTPEQRAAAARADRRSFTEAALAELASAPKVPVQPIKTERLPGVAYTFEEMGIKTVSSDKEDRCTIM